MRYPIPLGALVALALPTTLTAQASTDAFIKEAAAGGPPHISSAASIARLEPNGTLTVVREGTNGFTCFIIPDGTNAPACGDQASVEWFKAVFAGQPAPPNKVPGVAYMAKGGYHHETPSGEIVIQPGADTKQVAEPPHWMILWPFSAKETGLPSKPNAGGTYVMFGETPYSHLMVYQDPAKMK